MAIAVSTSPAIHDYDTLKAAVIRRMDRDDLEEIIPEAVQLTETYLSRNLRLIDQEATESIEAIGETVQLPDGCVSVRTVSLEGAPDRPLRAMSASAMMREYAGAGHPMAYTRIGNALKLAPAPSEGIWLDLVYITGLAPLTPDSTNWIIEHHPDLYFYGVLAQACDHIQDQAGIEKYTSLLVGMTQELVSARTRDRYGSGPLVPAGIKQVRGARI